MEMPTFPASTRPTQLTAEALLQGHDEGTIADRSECLGFSPQVTSAIIAACCGARLLPQTSHATAPAVSEPVT
jgi:hypothetical protein